MVAAGAAALCAATVGVGCVVIAGAVAGAAAAGAAYGVDVAQGERQFSVGELATEMAIGGVIGGATAGIGVLGRRVGSRIVNKFRRSCNSFVPGTAVAMADGTHKPIEDIQLGDQVLATDPETGQTNPEQVVATITGDGHKKLVEITVEDTREPDAEPDTVTATGGHPIWVANRGPDGKWIDAADLKPGDLLLTPDGATVRVIAIVAYGAQATVHNLTTTNHHTYYVSAGQHELLIHNCGGSLDPNNVRTHAAPNWRDKLNRLTAPHTIGASTADDASSFGYRVGGVLDTIRGTNWAGPAGYVFGVVAGWAKGVIDYLKYIPRHAWTPKHRYTQPNHRYTGPKHRKVNGGARIL